VSIMPKIIFDKLSVDSLVPTSMHLQLADHSIPHPVGITKDVPVRILGRPLLSTTRATIDVTAGIIKLNINGKEETYTFNPKRIEYCNQIVVSIGSREKSAKTAGKKPDTTKYSKLKSIWRIKNATSTTPPYPIASMK
jgi:hypothetical protein